MKRSKSGFAVLALSIFFGACNSVDFKKTPGGIPYKIFSSDKGDSIRLQNIVKFHVMQKSGDSVMFSSYKDNSPQYSMVQPIGTPAKYTDIRTAVMELLPRLKEGDSLYLVQSADSLIKLNPELEKEGPFKKGQSVVTTIKILDVFKTPEEADEDIMKVNAPKMKENIAKAEEMEKENLAAFLKDSARQAQLQKESRVIEDYLRKNNIQAQKTEWGLYIQVLDPGQGPKASIGKFTLIKYRGTHLSGQEFDAGQFPLQIGSAGSIKGFEEGAKQLAKGGKAKLIVPSVLGYGAEGREPTIKPNEILVFDIELLDISDRPIKRQPNIDTTQAH